VNRKVVLAAALAGALAPAAPAQAQVTLQPDAAPAGKFTRLDVRVPSKGDDATRKVVLELPPGFVFASYQPTPGWTIRVRTRTLAEPVTTGEGTVDREVSRISWTADAAKDRIPPGAFQDFGLSVRIPDGDPGTKLTFGALQINAGGDVVRWSDSADSATPAPQVTLSRAATPAAAADAQARATATRAATEPLPSRQLVIAALAAGALGVLFGLFALVARRR
jgi:uncharacterized protein YcnI